MNNIKREYHGMEVAVIGISCRFPGANTADEYWDNIIHCRESISFFSKDELRQAGVAEELLENPRYVRAKGIVKDYDEFDNNFFGYSKSEAEVMNPQMRIMHQCIWHALEDSGYIPEKMSGAISLYAGAASSMDWETLVQLSRKDNALDGMVLSTLTDKDFICSKIAYNLNLKGNVNFLHTACSTSLLAVHQACRGLQTGECKMALAGGISVDPHPISGYLYQDGMILSPDGHCRPFDEQSKGTVYSNGVGIVVLKLLRDAIKDGDHIYAVIKGSASNNDGNRKVSFSAPSINAQADVIRLAQRFAHITPEQVGYIETHGTATPLGDSIEIEALKMSFHSQRKHYCALGSVKGNIGHLDIASGIAGFIKCCYALKNRKLPPNINLSKANSNLGIENSPFYVNTEVRNWDNGQNPLYAGVSSFGIGGTNVHLVLEDAPEQSVSNTEDSSELIVTSATSKESLKQNITNLYDYLKNDKNANLVNIAYTLKLGRRDLRYRKSFYCKDIEDAKAKIEQADVSNVILSKKHKIVFMFAGLGNQYPNMGRGLYEKNEEFRNAVMECDKFVYQYAQIHVINILYPNEQIDRANELIHKFDLAQYCIFTFEYALAKLLQSWGITCDYVIGYSFGEFVAACISGLMSLDTAIQLIAYRASLIQSLPQGVMLSIPLQESKLASYLDDTVEVAITNQDSCIIAGLKEDSDRIEKLLLKDKILCTQVQNSYPIHTLRMQPIVPKINDFVKNITYENLKITFISGCTAKRLSKDDFTEYWGDQLVHTVHFDQTIREILKLENPMMIEIGAGNNLCSLLQRFKDEEKEFTAVNLVKNSHQRILDEDYISKKIGILWENGLSIQWKGNLFHPLARRVSLPVYPFEKKKYPSPVVHVEDILNGKEVTGIKKNRPSNDVKEWFYTPVWKQRADVEMKEYDHCNWLMIVNDFPLNHDILLDLQQNAKAIQVIRNRKEKSVEGNTYNIDFSKKAEFEEVIQKMNVSGFVPDKIMYLAGLEENTTNPLTIKAYDTYQITGFYGALYLLQSLTEAGWNHKMEMYFLTNELFRITGKEKMNPASSSLLAACKLIPTEYLNIRCKLIDIELSSLQSMNEKKWFLKHLPSEVNIYNKDVAVAVRGRRVWQQKFEHVSLKRNKSEMIREHGTYVIIGGFGGMGFTISEYLGKMHQAKIALIVRGEFPERKNWKDWLNKNDSEDQTTKRIKTILDIEREGGKVLVCCADITDVQQMENVFTKIKEEFCIIHGVIHAAGVVDYGGVIQRRTKETIHEYIESKVYGSMVLNHVLKDMHLDFLVYFSSIGNVLYNYKYGQIAYAIANEYLESIADALSYEKEYKVAVINWCDWLKVGMAVKTINRLHNGNTERIDYSKEIKDGIMPEQGTQVFDLFLNSELNKATINQNDLIELIREHNKLEQNISSFDTQPQTEVKNRDQRPNLSTEYMEPRTEIEKKLCHIFATFYGIDQIGIEDDFFELGCDSLKAMSLIAKLYQEFDVMITVNEFFKNATVELLADIILHKQSVNYYKINRIEPSEYYELSSAQKRQFILYKMDSVSTAYNISKYVKINETINYSKLKEAFQNIIDCHESLRTSFHVFEGKPVQKVHKKIDFHLVYLDESSKYTSSDQKDDVIDEMIHSFRKAFDLSRSPLLRAELVKLAEQEYLLMYEVHHIVSDAISMDLISEQLFSAYAGNKAQPCEIQYKDYAVWQNHFLKSEIVKRQREYWLSKFDGELPVLNLPLDFPRPVRQTFRGGSTTFLLDKETTRKLYELCRNSNSTIYMVILAAYNVFLSKITGQNDIIVGSPISGRMNETVEKMIGILVNVVAIRNELDPKESFQKFLDQVNDGCMKAYDNQDYQFETLVNDLKINVDLSRNPIFDTMFTLYRSAESTSEYSMNMETVDTLQKSARFDLTLEATEVDEELEFRFEYNIDLFHPDSIVRFTRYFLKLMHEICNQPSKCICEMELLSEDDKNELLYQFNNTKVAYDKDTTLVSLFEQQVRMSSDQTALKCGEKSLTYEELNTRANCLANTLRKKGVKRNDIVGLIVDRSVEMIVSMLAVIKAGGAYLPIDSAYPEGRKNELLVDASVGVVLIHKKYCNDIAFTGIKLFVDEEDSYDVNGSNPELVNKQEDLVYVIYTSGSTGKPKGVMIQHKNVVNFILGICNTIPMKETRVLALTTYTFDIFFLETMFPLVKGMTVYLAVQELLYSNRKLCDYMKDEKIEIMQVTPTRLNQICDKFTNFECLSNIKKLFVGGEPLGQKNLDVLKKYGVCEVYNMYGPTETTIWSTVKKLGDRVTIGKPISNTQIYIVDQNDVLLPIGVAGELCIAGDGLARGYLNRQELTESKFKPIPSIRVSRAYRTGDQARWRADGEIECLGRIDNQVKVNGYRIELEEIEQRILQVEGVTDAIVVKKMDQSGNPYLCAYYVCKNDTTNIQLFEYMKNNLPIYMVPQYIEKIREIPLTTNGKVNKNALPEPELIIEKQRSYIEPRNHAEKVLAKIWCKIFELNQVSIDDNFFDLGGQSLRVIELESALEKEGYSADYMMLYELKTIRCIAAYINHESVDVPRTEETVKQSDELQNETSGVKELSNVEPFNFIYYKNCFFNSLISVIQHFGGNSIAPIANDTELYHCYETKQDTMTLRIDFMVHNNLEDVLKQMGILCESMSQCSNLEQTIIHAIDQEKCVVVWIDVYYEPFRKDVYQKEHMQHSILIYGYDLKKQTYRVIEQIDKESLSYEKATISFYDLSIAYQNYMNIYSESSDFDSYYEFSFDESRKVIEDHTFYKDLYKKQMMECFDFRKNQTKDLQRYIEYIHGVILSKERILKEADGLISSINDVVKAKEAELYLYKNLYGTNSDITKLLEFIVETWTLLRANLLRISFQMTYKKERFIEIGKKLNQICDLETKILHLICDHEDSIA